MLAAIVPQHPSFWEAPGRIRSNTSNGLAVVGYRLDRGARAPECLGPTVGTRFATFGVWLECGAVFAHDLLMRQDMSGIGLSFGLVTANASQSGGTGDLGKSKAAGSSAVDDFLAYMKKSLAEHMADAWLAAHGLDREKLKAMKPEEREAVLKQMAEDLKKQMAEAADKAAGRKTAAA